MYLKHLFLTLDIDIKTCSFPWSHGWNSGEISLLHMSSFSASDFHLPLYTSSNISIQVQWQCVDWFPYDRLDDVSKAESLCRQSMKIKCFSDWWSNTKFSTSLAHPNQASSSFASTSIFSCVDAFPITKVWDHCFYILKFKTKYFIWSLFLKLKGNKTYSLLFKTLEL